MAAVIQSRLFLISRNVSFLIYLFICFYSSGQLNANIDCLLQFYANMSLIMKRSGTVFRLWGINWPLSHPIMDSAAVSKESEIVTSPSDNR